MTEQTSEQEPEQEQTTDVPTQQETDVTTDEQPGYFGSDAADQGNPGRPEDSQQAPSGSAQPSE